MTATTRKPTKKRGIKAALKDILFGSCGNPRCGRQLTWQDRAYKSGALCKNCAAKVERARLRHGKRLNVTPDRASHGAGATITGRWPAPEMRHWPAYQRMFPVRGRKAGRAA